MTNRNIALIIALVVLAIGGAVVGVNYWTKNPSKISNNTTNKPTNNLATEQTPTIIGTPADADTRSVSEQLASLENTKTVVPQIVVPGISNQSDIAKEKLPQAIISLIDTNPVSFAAFKVSYADKTSGNEIQYSMKKNLGSVVLGYFHINPNNNWKIVTSLKSAKAALIDLDSAGYKAHVLFTQTGDLETTVKISAISK